MPPVEKSRYKLPAGTSGFSSRFYTITGGSSSLSAVGSSGEIRKAQQNFVRKLTTGDDDVLTPPTTSVVSESEMIQIQGMDCCFHTWKSKKEVEDPSSFQPPPKALIVYLHGANTHGTFPTTRYVCDNLISNGYAFMSFDFPGHGKTSGLRGMLESPDLIINFGVDIVEHAVRTYEIQIANAMQTGKYKSSKNKPGMKVFLVGSSLGGNIALQVALRRKDLVSGVVLLAPMLKLPIPLSGVTRYLLKALATAMPFQEAIPVGDNKHYRCPAKLKECESDKLKPFSKGDKIRLGSVSTLMELSLQIQSQFNDITFPCFVMIGDDDSIVDNSGAEDLINQSPSKDTILKRYPAKHGIMGEPSPLYDHMQSDLVKWIDARCSISGAGQEPLPLSRL